MATFLIRRSSPNGTLSGVLPSTAAAIGTAYKITSKDADTGLNTFALADGTNFDGFVTKPVSLTAGYAEKELAFPAVDSNYESGGEIMTPFTVSTCGSIEDALAIEVEDTANLLTTSGATGALTAGTKVGTYLSFASGKVYVAQTGDVAFFKLRAQMTATDGGLVRVYATRCASHGVVGQSLAQP